MKRLVVCFDGTWNSSADEGLPPADRVETNVSRFHQSVATVAADGIEQESVYLEGVGTGGKFDHWVGGLLGAGLDRIILSGYQRLAELYEDGDEVYVLGFSRGAYAARSLVGLIRNCGLVRSDAPDWIALMFYGIYRTRDDKPDSLTARTFRAMYSRAIRVRFLGVWDTVGALGIPIDVAGKFNSAVYKFHDTKLSGIVDHAYHAIALDEHRADYDVTLWDAPANDTQVLEQRWFAGAHSDVGGGYASRGLSDLALRWMQERAAAVGLGVKLVEPDPDAHRAALTDSYDAFMNGQYKKFKPRHVRRVLSNPAWNEVIDPSVAARRAAVEGYRPANPGLPT